MAQDEPLTFAVFFRQKLKDRNITLKKLSEMSGIAVKHLENLSAGNLERLPSAPYLRGYLNRLGQVLDFDPEPWWDALIAEGWIARSGGGDMLPRNRFARVAHLKYVAGAVALLMFLILLATRYSTIIGKPKLTVAFPTRELITTNENPVLIYGTVENSTRLTVNGEVVPTDEGGRWEKNIVLEVGLNAVEVYAEKFLGRDTSVVRTILYEPTQEGPADNQERTDIPPAE